MVEVDDERREAVEMVRARVLDELGRGAFAVTPVVELSRVRTGALSEGDEEEVSERDEAGKPAAVEVEEVRRPYSS